MPECHYFAFIVTTLIKNHYRPSHPNTRKNGACRGPRPGLIFIFFYVFPGFRCALPWANFWSRPSAGSGQALRRFGSSFCKQSLAPK
jgi:hypothetical protein